jgi:hypothetical protein
MLNFNSKHNFGAPTNSIVQTTSQNLGNYLLLVEGDKSCVHNMKKPGLIFSFVFEGTFECMIFLTDSKAPYNLQGAFRAADSNYARFSFLMSRLKPQG